MTDWSRSPYLEALGATVHSAHPAAATANLGVISNLNYASASAPVANRALYIPFFTSQGVTARRMFWENGTAVAGTTDVGIYNTSSGRLISSGPQTNTGISSFQSVAVTATFLPPGVYYMALLPSIITTQTYLSISPGFPATRACGVLMQNVGAATLPNPATFTRNDAGTSFIPLVGISFQSVI